MNYLIINAANCVRSIWLDLERPNVLRWLRSNRLQLMRSISGQFEYLRIHETVQPNKVITYSYSWCPITKHEKQQEIDDAK